MCFKVRVMVFNATFNNISVISRWSVLLMEETEENHRSVASHKTKQPTKAGLTINKTRYDSFIWVANLFTPNNTNTRVF